MDCLGVRSLPFLTRRNYYFEIRQIVFWSVVAGLVEGNFGSVVVARSFGGGPLLVAIATATPVAAFITSLVWGLLCVGRPKVRLLTLFSAGAALFAGIAGAIPSSPAGAVWFICQMAAAQVLMAGVLTVRSAVWKSNYPQVVRGRIAARLQGVRFVVAVVTALGAAALCDRNPDAYRFLYPAASVFGLVAAFLASRLHIRGERRQLAHRNGGGDDEPYLRRGQVEPFSLTALMSPGRVFGQMIRVLRDDERYRTYCIAQSFTGLANLMTISIVASVVTRDLDIGPAWGFWIGTALLVAIPQLTVLGSLGRWGGLFDRLGVLGFRVVNVSCWVAAVLAGFLATVAVGEPDCARPLLLPLSVALFAVRGVFYGLGRGGGALAWHIGHLHFADSEQAEVYMGIHVFLTGVRGIVAPIGGILLWQWIGWPVWLIALGFACVSLWMYWRMARDERRAGAVDGGRRGV